jgi:hypothetical protein
MVMSMWNKLTQGHPVSFEMRWKPQIDGVDDGTWTLASCVPIFDEEKNLISIAGNVIDIDAQKKSQEATQARIEALEQVRLSELKFARFAQLSPTAIFIFVPETGKSRKRPTSKRVPYVSLVLTSSRYAICQRPILRIDRIITCA